MSENIIMYILAGSGALLVLIIIAYLIIRKTLNKGDAQTIRKLKEGTEQKKFSTEILYQKLYVYFLKIPVIKRYTLKIRRRLEITNIEDEYLTRKQTAKVITKALLVVLPFTILILILTSSNIMLLCILLLFEVFFIETLVEGMVDKIDNKILKQQIDFFAEIRHSYHEYNMVEEAIYEVAQNDELEVSRQADKIYEILTSNDPETELEKYYDIAPNSYLKEFAGISYLTKEFGDRKIDGASLYLKNLNNITQEMQLEILKRDKLDYVFQSLSLIAAVPIMFIEPLKSWAVSQFSFTNQFYGGKGGMIVQILILIITFVCYVLIRKLKDSGDTSSGKVGTDNPWQAKIYKNPFFKKIIDLFIPKKNSKENRKMVKLMKDSASKSKIEWIYINRICACVLSFMISLVFFIQLHRIAIKNVYEEPTSNYDVMGMVSESDQIRGMELTEQDNYFLEIFKNKNDVTKEEIIETISESEYYEGVREEKIAEDADRLYTKLQIVKTEHLQWFELLLAAVVGFAGYYAPVAVLVFQSKMRQLEMENEVMQFQTIILMLMKIERVNVEIILEWIERYSNIFREPISKCVNNYESGAWEALEELKNDVSQPQLIRIVESLQASVEKIPIADAFDELDTERAYYQEKRKESNERLISRKGLIGKAIGFAPMICLFVGYLIVPLVVIGISSMTSSFNSMSGMM